MTPVKQSIGSGKKDCTPFETIVDHTIKHTVRLVSCLWAESTRAGDFQAIVFHVIACTWQKTQPWQVIAFCSVRNVDNFSMHSLQVPYKFNEFLLPSLFSIQSK